MGCTISSCFSDSKPFSSQNSSKSSVLQLNRTLKKQFSLSQLQESPNLSPNSQQKACLSLRRAKSFNHKSLQIQVLSPHSSRISHSFSNEPELSDFSIVKEFDHEKVYKGKRYLVSKKTNPNVLFTMTNCKKSLLTKELNELYTIQRFLFECSCPFVSRIQYLIENITNLYIFQLYFSGLDLAFQLSRLTFFKEKIAKFYLCEMILALENLPYNVALFQSLGKSLDMKSMLLDRDGHLSINIVSPILRSTKKLGSSPDERYQPPELLTSAADSQQKSSFSAIFAWKLGVFLYEMLCGTRPFADVREIAEKNTDFPENLQCSREAIDLIEQLLRKNSLKRLGNCALQEVKNHAFFQGVRWGEVFEKKTIGPLALSSKDEKFIAFEETNAYFERNLHAKYQEKDANDTTNERTNSFLSNVSEKDEEELTTLQGNY